MTARDTQLDSELVQQIFAEAGFDLTPSHRQQLLSKDAIRYTIDRYCESIFRILPTDANRKLKGRIFAAEFPTGEFNAQAKMVPDGGGYVVLVNIGLMLFLHSVAKLVFTQARWGSQKRSGTWETTSTPVHLSLSFEDAVAHLREAVGQYITSGMWLPTADREHVAIQDSDINMLLLRLVEASERFVLTHEFSHAILGHLDREATVTLAMPDGTETVSIISKSSQEEYDADLFAAALLSAGFPRHLERDDHATAIQIQTTIAGPLFFFALDEIIREAGGSTRSTHPPSKERAQKLRSYFATIVPPQAFSIANAATGLLEHLWRDNEP